jgi:hypothetical protein
MLDREPLRIRKSMYLGWLFPVAVWAIQVKPPKEAASPKPPGEGDGKKPENGGASVPPEEVDPALEQRAKNLWKKAEEAEAAGEREKAKTLYREISTMGPTSLQEKADEKLKALETKGG